ncbi:MAG: hypothetical protein AAGU73_09285 [Actinomycetota bacterium]
MAILKREGADTIYAVARLFREQALERDGSLLTPGRSIWTASALEDLEQRFVRSPDSVFVHRKVDHFDHRKVDHPKLVYFRGFVSRPALSRNR